MIFKSLLLLSALYSMSSHARVVDLSKESIAPYFRGTGGLSAVGADAFANAKGAQTRLGDDQSNVNYSGELGVLFHLHKKVNFRLGLEVMQSGSVSGLKGENAAGTELYTLESTNFIWHPNVVIEFIHKQGNSYRLFTYVGGGYSNLTVDNEYEMTTAGSAAYVPSYKEKLEGTTTSYSLGTGFEVVVMDSTTFEMDLGYRFMKFGDLKHESEVRTIQGSFHEGDTGINDDSSPRKLDFSGFYIGVSFRFYVEVI